MSDSKVVTVWYLAMEAPAELHPAAAPSPPGLAIAVEDDPALNRALYHEIGAEHHWVDLRAHDVDWWRQRLSDRVTLVARVDGEVAGYAELAPKDDGSVDLAYFGIRGAFQGRGVGGRLLSEATRFAWRELRAQRVTVDTCALDGAPALPNYKQRGFHVIREAQERRGLLEGVNR
jgi:GNAT superfamily N-acetyltransferase